MQPIRGFTWSGAVARPLGLVAAIVILLSANVGAALAAGGGYDPAQDLYSMANTTTVLGARAWWDAGYSGRGVDVALIEEGPQPPAEKQ